MNPSFLDALAPINWPTFAILSARVAGLVLSAPIWSGRVVPKTVRLAFAVLLTLLLLPAVPPVVVPEGVVLLPLLMASELLLGVAMGVAASMFVHAVQVGAAIVSVQMGLSLGGALAPTLGSGAPGIGEFKNMMALVIYVTLGGHLSLIAGLGSSLDLIQPGSPIDFVTGSLALVSLAGGLFATAVRVAAPIMVALLLTNIALAILGKAVPQLNVLMLAFPITIGVGLVVFGAALPYFQALIVQWVEGVPGSVGDMIEAFAPSVGAS
jgi:flagellar biosynthetic protein FliR